MSDGTAPPSLSAAPAKTETASQGKPTGDAPDAPKKRRSPGADGIEKLETALGVRVIVYYADHDPMGWWDVDFLHRILEDIGPQKRAAFVINTPGGDPDAAHVMSNMLREYIEHVDVYILGIAASAGTLFALGADTLWMGPSSMISPIDPQVPVDPRLIIPTFDPDEFANDPIHIPAHVVRDFLEFAGVLGNDPERPPCNVERLTAFLDTKLNPFILGWYEAADKVSRIYAREALENHLLRNEPDAGAKADHIVETLLRHYASHGAGILRSDARRIGIPVSDCSAEVWALLRGTTAFYSEVVHGQPVARVLDSTNSWHALRARATRECPHCDEWQDGGRDFQYCTACGKALDQRCEKCAGVLSAEWKFCARCGAAVPPPEPAVAPGIATT